ncbi:hypothetical protein OPV22_001356 [Ensete ventricosum]|uniref:non-specific serine/threonine protein kinase n=1 Tax=Ensete ventricosum TaxID=4639 RepID=A0AAV8RW71_ENSVE|nr:hypothetical protein OPV22_001356 [Ensete ventricosum]
MSGVGSPPLLNDELSKRTAVFGLHMWVVVGICVGAAFVLLLFLISLWLASRHGPPTPSPRPIPTASIPIVSKEIQEIRVDPSSRSSAARPLGEILRKPLPESDPPSSASIERQALLTPALEEESPIEQQKIHIEIGKGHRIMYPERGGGGGGGGVEGRSAEHASIRAPEVSHLGWGHWYTLRELEVATNMFADENVIGEGGYGIVYHGVLQDTTQIAVKNLLNNRGQAEREFTVEVEAIGRVRHKNLVRLLGYCVEGAHRILVYEYADNGNLDQWLHGGVGRCSPLTWEIRMNIILGTAKGLMYLHEGLEPKLLGSERNYVTTRVMGTFGYVAPEYASTGMLNERSDVYSFGVLIMEIISGRNPVDYNRPTGEVNLIEWIKTMVSNRNSEGVLDPKLLEKPSSRALKRALLVALRCIDPDSQKRPKMGHVIHMLEVNDFPYRDERQTNETYRNSPLENAKPLEIIESGDSSGHEGNTNVNRPSRWRKQDN